MAQVQAIPDGMRTIIPHLICSPADDAIEFYKKAFNATERARLKGDDGKVMHAMLFIGESPFMLNDEFPDYGALGPKSRKGTSVTMHFYVEDVDAAIQRAVDAGAKIIMPVGDMFWGDRYGVVEDPFGHHWSMATHKRDVGYDEMKEAMRAMSKGPA